MFSDDLVIGLVHGFPRTVGVDLDKRLRCEYFSEYFSFGMKVCKLLFREGLFGRRDWI